jgi:GT2 family glycosyltransferase
MSLAEGNKLFKAKRYKQALAVYKQLLRTFHDNVVLVDAVNFNIQLTEQKLEASDPLIAYEFNVPTEIQSSKWKTVAFKLFDQDFYEKMLSDRDIKHNCKYRIDYFNHFFEYGESQKLQPHPAFSSSDYKRCNSNLFPNECLSGCFKHFILSGAIERKQFWTNPTAQHHNEYFRFKVIELLLIDWERLSQKSIKKNAVSIIIPVYGEPKYLENCVKSIFSSQTNYEFEVILVDNKKDHETTRTINFLAKDYHDIKIQSNPFNFNFALGCNSGLLHAEGEYIIFLNTDTIVEDNWIDKLVRPLFNPLIRAVQPKLIYPNNKVQTVGTVLSDWSYMPFELYKNEPIDAKHVNYSRAFNILTAACLVVRTTDVVRHHGFNTKYINGCEDIDFCLRLIENYKYKCWYESSVTVRHHESKSSGRGKWNEVNRIFFVQHWKNKIRPDVDQYLNDDGLTADFEIDSRIRQKRRIHSCFAAKYSHSIPKYPQNNPLFELFSVHDSDKSGNKSPDFCVLSDQIITDNKKPTVLLVGHIAGKQIFGGERSFIDMIEALDLLNVNIIVTLPNKPSSEYQNILFKYASKIYVFPYTWWKPLEPFGRIESQLFYDICKSEFIDFIYVNTIMPHSYQYASESLAIPVIIHVRELILDDDTLQKKLNISKRDIIAKIIGRSDYLIANSIATQKMFATCRSIKIARNIVNISAYAHLVQSKKLSIRFGMISSNIYKKGINDFFQLASRCKNVKNAKFLLIGPVNSEVKQLAEDLSSENLNIEILGYIPDPVEAISKVDVVLSLSKFSESFGRTIAEGFAGKKPSIAYNRGAVSELIIDGKTGFLIPKDDLETAAKRVREISQNPSIISEMGENALSHLKEICSQDQLKMGIAHSLIMSWVRKCTNVELLYRRSDNIVSRILKNPNSVNSLVASCSKSITIVIPIFNAFYDIKACIDSVISTCDLKHVSIILIDDCSTDSRVLPYLQSLHDYPRVTIVSNQKNIGYTKSINKAIQISGDSDVILLNSDTVVNNDWLIQLQLAAYSSPDVATVTPMSNNAGAFSFPTANSNNIIPPQISFEDAARKIVLSTQYHDCQPLPTGNGFCMYIKREALDIVGLFDENLFPRGYGEENHFCMRVIQNKMINLLCPHAYIFHTKSASFKSERTKLVEEGQKVLLRQFPSYPSLVRRDFNTQELKSIRNTLDHVFESFLKII